MPDDDGLIRRSQAGDRKAFDALLNEYYDTMYRFAYQWCHDQHNAQDITQQACIKLARSLTQFRFESSFTSWLYRLVINCAKDYYKSPNQYNQLDSDNQAESATDGRLAERHYARQILEHIGKLPNELRDTLILIFGSGLNHKQAALRLGVKESTVSWRVHEARKQLKHTFDSPNLHSSSTAETARGAV